MSDSNDENKKESKTNTYLAIGLGLIAVFSMLVTMFVMSGAKIPT